MPELVKADGPALGGASRPERLCSAAVLTWFHAAQLVLAASVVPIVVERIRTLFYEAPIEARPVLRVLGPVLEQGDWERAKDLASRGRPAWICDLVVGVLEEAEEEGHVALAIEERVLQARWDATRRVAALKGLGRIQMAAAVLGALVAAIGALTGGFGLEGLVAGLPERLAMGRAVTSLAIGATAAFLCQAVARLCAKQASRLLGEVRQTVELLERTVLGDGDEA